MKIAGMPDTCTARHFFDMPRDLTYIKQYQNPSFTQEMWDASYGVPLRKKLIEQLNLAKSALIVNVFAFLVEGSQKQAAAILEEYGFTRVADYNNYKYKDSSKRLWMYSMDMNNWEKRALPKTTKSPEENPFAVRVAPEQVAPAPQPALTEAQLAAPLAVLGIRVRGTVYRAAPRANAPLSYRSLSAIMATRTASGRFRTENGGTVADPFPVGQWVAMPVNFRRVPPTMYRQRFTWLTRDGRIGVGTWTFHDDLNIVAVKRL